MTERKVLVMLGGSIWYYKNLKLCIQK